MKLLRFDFLKLTMIILSSIVVTVIIGLYIIVDLAHVIDFYVGDIHAQAVGILLGLLGCIVERIGFYLIFVALAVLGVDDCLVEVPQIIVVAIQAGVTDDGCLMWVIIVSCLNDLTCAPWGFSIFTCIQEQQGTGMQMQGISMKILKNLICTANQESVSEFSAEIVPRYLQDAACANFAK